MPDATLPQGSIPQVLEILGDYIKHKRECRKWGDSLGSRLYGGYDCSCGLDELLTALRSLASPEPPRPRTPADANARQNDYWRRVGGHD